MLVIHRQLAAACAIVLGLAVPAVAQQVILSPEQKAEIDKMIGDYILNHPEIVRDALIALERQQAAEEQAKQKEMVVAKADEIFRAGTDQVVGNKDGDVTLVEFFDYNCGYCKRALSDLNSLMEQDKNLRIVLKEFPILSQGSLEAAQYAIAARKQGKYLEYHRALLADRGRMDGARALEVAADIGLDVDALKKDAADPQVREAIKASHALATDLGINGTPAYVLGDEIVPGAIGADALGEKIAALRTQQKQQSN